MDLPQLISERKSEFLLFAVTPPRSGVSGQRAQEVADITLSRLQTLDLDGLVLYDIDDESDRNPRERPFPFLPTMDPADFLDKHLAALDMPVVVYRAVGKYTEQELQSWMRAQDRGRVMTVFVGASSRGKPVTTTLGRATELRAEERPDLLLGGVAIPERHTRRGQEHQRLIAKQSAGCSFFITQVVYDVNSAKNLVSDYRYECEARGIALRPLVFTFTVCGSMKTLEFLRWLGIEVPRWIENDLRHADDTLETSYQHALAAARELIDYCRRLNVPFGINVESVSNRRREIETSVILAAQLRTELNRP